MNINRWGFQLCTLPLDPPWIWACRPRNVTALMFYRWAVRVGPLELRRWRNPPMPYADACRALGVDV